MAVTDQQKLDFLLKKIGYTKTKTGSVVGTGAISGTPKQPFAEAIPSPLIIANGALWNESDQIPTTPPGSDTTQVKVYLAASSGLRMTADSTSSGQRAFIAYSTYNDTSSTRLTNWIDTQFGSAYLIKVYKGDPNSGGVALSAAGSGANDGWFFDYSAGVLNFNDTNVPSGVTDTNIYIVGYRYIGLTGAPTPTGGGDFTFNDLVVSRNFSVGGLSTFTGNIDANGIIEGIAGENKIPSLYANLGALPSPVTYHGMFAHVHSTGRGYFSHAGGWYELVNRESNGVVGTGTEAYNIGNINAVDGTFTGNVSIGGTLTYEDVKNVDAVGLITARSGIRVTGGVIEAQAGENKIPSLYAAMGNLPSAGSYHGMFAHVHATGRGYFAHAGNWLELVNRETNGVVGTGTETYNIGNLVSTSTTATSLNVTGVTTAVTLDVNGDLDVDGHTNLDNLSVAGVTTFSGNIGGTATFQDIDVDGHTNLDNVSVSGITTFSGIVDAVNTPASIRVAQDIQHKGDADTKISFPSADTITFDTAGTTRLNIASNGNISVTNDIDVDGHTNLDNVSVAGVSTFTGNVDANGDLDVDGHTNLDNVSIAGVTTTAGLLDINNGGQANTFKVEDLTSGRVVLAGTGGELEDSSNLTFDGNNLFVRGINIIGGGATSVLGADIVTRNLKATGVSTFVGDVQFDSGIKADGSTGSNGQYLKTTGSGVEWASFPTMRTTQTFTASAGQTTFSFSYNIGFLDVFVNGVKLTPSEFTATNGSTVVLAVGCFVGDIVDVISYHTVSGGGGGGGGGISNVVEDTTPQLGGNLDLFNKSITGTGNVNITGIITATNFIGDGSGLTNVIGSGSGVVIKNDDNTVGTAGTINFAENLSVTPISAGIVTVGFSSASLDVNKLNVTGITSFVGVTSYSNRVDFRGGSNNEVWFWAHPNLPNSHMVWRSTVAGGNGGLYLQNSKIYLGVTGAPSRTHINQSSSNGLRIEQYTSTGDNPLRIRSDYTHIAGSPTNSHSSREIAEFNYLDGCSLYFNDVKKLQTCGVGATVYGQLDVTNINASGVTTTTEVRSNALSLKNAAGSATYATFSNGGSALLKHNNTDRLETSASGVTVTGTVAATSYTGDGSQLTGIGAGSTANVRTNTLEVVGVSTFAGITTVTGNTLFTKQLSVSGISTFARSVRITGAIQDFTVDSGTFRYDNGKLFLLRSGQNAYYYSGVPGGVKGPHVFYTHAGGSTVEMFRLNGDTGATLVGVMTATKFVGDGSGLTNVIGSGSGVVIKNNDNTVGTAGTINFGDNLDVTAISAGIVTVSTATTSITSGNSKVFVNDESTTSNNGSFEIFLSDSTSSGAAHTAFRIYNPSANTNSAEFFHNNSQIYSNIALKAIYGGGTNQAIYFRTNNSNYAGSIVHSTGAGEFNFYNTYQGTQYNPLRILTNQLYTKAHINPLDDNTYDLGYSSGGTNLKWRQIHVTNVNAGVVTATTFHGDGSNLTGISGGGGTNVGITTNLSGSFTASAGTPATINTFAYHDNDKVVEYTVYIKNGSDFQSQKLLAMRDGTTIHSTQFAVMFSSSLLVQCDATISSGNILLRATPETGVSGSTTYKIKREVM